MKKEVKKKKIKKKGSGGDKALADIANGIVSSITKGINALVKINAGVQSGVKKLVSEQPLLSGSKDALILLAVYTILTEAVAYVRFEDYGATLVTKLAPVLILGALSLAPRAAAAIEGLSTKKESGEKK